MRQSTQIPGDVEPLLTSSEVATLFRVDPKTVTRWAQAGKIGSVRTLGGHHRYRATEVRALLEKPDNPGPPPSDPADLRGRTVTIEYATAEHSRMARVTEGDQVLAHREDGTLLDVSTIDADATPEIAARILAGARDARYVQSGR